MKLGKRLFTPATPVSLMPSEPRVSSARATFVANTKQRTALRPLRSMSVEFFLFAAANFPPSDANAVFDSPNCAGINPAPRLTTPTRPSDMLAFFNAHKMTREQ